ncbi:sugar ABC transporter substrate-binding protein [Brevibacillus ruminantium]|uniref:Sugar ABC transporter substrate-binding protein n=1 Tax=Brevibacillus ruminantium TaxID=2950604 RepID=A0ABY4WL24_9BACL|nr:sugar ABC transporter substrate-binding protein [Brevibacillus ruminantium]USG65351.1 sugar ABC transporter substrate-binding protein [Brevibacillus ruminantium]
MKKTFKGMKAASGLFATIMGLSAVLAGCGGGGQQAAPQQPAGGEQNAAPAPAKTEQTIRLVAANHPWTEGIKPLLPDFEKETGIKVKVDSYFEDQLTQKTSVEFAANSKSIDVVMFRPLQDGKQYEKNGYFASLNDFVSKEPAITDDIIPSSLGAVKEGDKLYGFPLVTETQVLYYRKDLLEAAGLQPPKTLDELKEQAAKLTDPNAGVYGFVSRGKRSPSVTQFSSFLYSFGGDFMKDGKATLDTPEALQAFEYYGGLLKDYGPPGTLNMSWPEAFGVFTQGKAAFLTDASSLYTNATDPSKSSVADKVGFAPFPAGPAGSKPYNITSWAIGIGANSEKKDAAWEFVKWATSKEVVGKLQATGISGALKSVWDSPEGTASFPKDLTDAIKANSDSAVPYDRPLIVNVGKARDAIGDSVNAAIQGKDVKAALAKSNQEFQAVLDTE